MIAHCSFHRRLAVSLAVGALALASTACGSDGDSATSTASTTTTSTTASTTTAADAQKESMRGQRYCEVLLVNSTEGAMKAEVYNSWPLNDCPDEQWTKLDTAALAKEHGAALAVLNGPRYWLMDSVKKAEATMPPKATFGGIEMYLQATVDVGSMQQARTPYVPHEVDRKTTFTFNAGSTVFELHAADGSTFVMQTWAQNTDASLTEADLAGLASRLTLPAGWTYSSRTLTEPLRVVTTDAPAHVLQDDLQNSYSLETPT